MQLSLSTSTGPEGKQWGLFPLDHQWNKHRDRGTLKRWSLNDIIPNVRKVLIKNNLPKGFVFYVQTVSSSCGKATTLKWWTKCYNIHDKFLRKENWLFSNKSQSYPFCCIFSLKQNLWSQTKNSCSRITSLSVKIKVDNIRFV